MAWTLDDAEARASQAPQSFFIPPAELRHSLKVGDGVKLIFRLERDDGETSVERMWVEVVETGPYVGILRNTAQLADVVAPGERIAFGPEHVCGYAYSVAELGYDPDVPCFLLKRVGESDTPPPLLLCNEDGEWEAHDLEETDEELADSANVLSWPLGYLTDRFPQTTHALQEGSQGPGLRWRAKGGVWWRWSGDRYVRAE